MGKQISLRELVVGAFKLADWQTVSCSCSSAGRSAARLCDGCSAAQLLRSNILVEIGKWVPDLESAAEEDAELFARIVKMSRAAVCARCGCGARCHGPHKGFGSSESKIEDFGEGVFALCEDCCDELDTGKCNPIRYY